MELSIDTSTRYASVGLSRDGEAVAEMAWRSERNHSVELVPAVRGLAERVGIELDCLEAVFVARGPGAFSALRVGISTAKALADGRGIPLISVGTLDVEAASYLGMGSPVLALIGAGRERVYAGRYGVGAELAEAEIGIVTYDELAETIATDGWLLCGEAAETAVEKLGERLSGRPHVVAAPPPTRRAAVLARLAYRRWTDGDIDDPASLQPIYLRSSQVDASRRRGERVSRPASQRTHD